MRYYSDYTFVRCIRSFFSGMIRDSVDSSGYKSRHMSIVLLHIRHRGIFIGGAFCRKYHQFLETEAVIN